MKTKLLLALIFAASPVVAMEPSQAQETHAKTPHV